MESRPTFPIPALRSRRREEADRPPNGYLRLPTSGRANVPQASRLRVLGASRPESVRAARRRPNSQARTPAVRRPRLASSPIPTKVGWPPVAPFLGARVLLPSAATRFQIRVRLGLLALALALTSLSAAPTPPSAPASPPATALLPSSVLASPAAAFEHANKLYEQTRYPAAAQTYQLLLDAGAASAELHFNLGNALFKSGQVGQSLYHYRLAEHLAPRDPDIRANLQFARKVVRGGLVTETPWWSRALATLTLDEWTALTAALLWLWLLTLAAGQWSAELRRALAGYTATAGVTALLAAALLGAAWNTHRRSQTAIVIVPEAVVRYGPLEESQSAFTLRDGFELAVLDEKDGWLQILDDTRRAGWVRKEQVRVIGPTAANAPRRASGT